jgi:adenylate kinase
LRKNLKLQPVFSTISFIGGIHGVGKSTICNNLCSRLGIHYLSASEVLKWTDLNTDIKNKKVENISLTQDRLINGLLNIVEQNKHYLLDGHYCLLDKDGKITRVPFTTFEAINPVSLHLVIGDVNTIKSRIEARDKRNYDYETLKDMQEQEIAYAKELSVKLNVKLSVGQEGDYSEIYEALKSI